MLINYEGRKKKSIPSNYRIQQIQAGWKGRIYIMRSVSERCSPIEDIKSANSFNITNIIAELGSPSIIVNSTLIIVDDLEVELSKLKDKWVGEFGSLSNFFDENIRTWTVDYVNLYSIILNIVIKAREEIIEIEKKMFEMKIK